MALWASFRVRVLLRLSSDGGGFGAFFGIGRRSLLVLRIGEGLLVGELLLRLSSDGGGFDAFFGIGHMSLLVIRIGEGLLVGELRFIFAGCMRFVCFFLVCGGGDLLGWFFVHVQASFCSLRDISI
jgi:hypothetical protein